MTLTEGQNAILGAGGHVLVTGGPGSGKTTVSILKAARIAKGELSAGQKVLFLSFARATVSRVIEAIEYEQEIPREIKRRIEVETYHSFFWRILKTHGYLAGLPRRLSLLAPPAEAVALSSLRNAFGPASKLTDDQKKEKSEQEHAERRRLAVAEGNVCFDLFAHFFAKILHGSERIRKLIATVYPVIILDEFQDTNADQWHVVRALGKHSDLIALADPEQRIYDWIGADPERLNHFREQYSPSEIDLSTDNHRSRGTDINAFANDILTGTFRDDPYSGIEVTLYPPNESQAFSGLITTAYRARKRCIDSGRKNWSLAVLVPTKKMTRLVSDAFRNPPAGMSAIRHEAVIEMDSAMLAAEVIARLLQREENSRHLEQVINVLCGYFQGKGGNLPTQAALKEADIIRGQYEEWLQRRATGKPIRKNSKLVATIESYEAARALSLIGNPDKDWLEIRRILEGGPCARMKSVASDARNIQILERGTRLRDALSQDWRDNGTYANALTIIRQSFVQEHFSTNAKPEKGVVVMNMHKAKGKQFDEVIIFEGWPRISKGKIVANADRIVRQNARDTINDQMRQNFRVSVTRGKRKSTILTPKNDPCVLLIGKQ